MSRPDNFLRWVRLRHKILRGILAGALGLMSGLIGRAENPAATLLRSQAFEEFPLYGTEVFTPNSPSELITYRSRALDDRGFNRLVDNVSVPTLTVYRPAPERDRGVTLVICPGGGYGKLTIDTEGHALARYFQQQGITAAVLKYRLPRPAVTGEGLPLSQQDGLAAIAFMRRHAGAWHLNANRIGILGCSAGGHLAGSVAILGGTAADNRPDFAVLLYPVVLMDGAFVHAGSRLNLLGPTPSSERRAQFSLERQVRADLPPFFIVHALDDKVVPAENSIQLAAALKGVGVSVELLLVEKDGHGFGLGRRPESARWKQSFLTWLDHIPATIAASDH